MVIPGFLANDRTTLGLQRALAAGGFRVTGWGLGLNSGVSERTVEAIVQRIAEYGGGRKVILVGWSLGGLYAREFARRHPDKVVAVVTLGTPFSGDLHQNNVWPLYERVAGHKVDDPPVKPLHEKPPVPHLALWSRRDGLIAPRSARGLDHERDEAVELDCHHMAFGVSKQAARDVVREIRGFLDRRG